MKFKPYPKYKPSGVEWLGDVPEGWRQSRLRFGVALNPSKSETAELDRDTEVSFLPMEAIGGDGSIDIQRTKPISEVETGYTYFRDGDVTIAKITPCFENGKGARMRGLKGGIGFGTTELIVARPRQNLDGEFLHWLFVSEPFRKQGEAHMYGAGGQKRVPDDFVRNFDMAWPPLEMQIAIATFLARETTKIDTLITKQEKLIELLQEKRQAAISHAVTKGLDPNVPMNPSGVEWLGDVPEHRKRISLRHICELLRDGTHLPPPRVDHGVPLLSVRNIQNDRFSTREDDSLISDASHEELCRSFVVEEGDVLLATVGATLGKVAVVEAAMPKFHIQRSLAVLRASPHIMIGRYLAYYLRCDAFQATLWSRVGFSAQPGIYLGVVSGLDCCVPDLQEQAEVIEYLDNITIKIDTLIAKAQQAIELQKEHRSALISAAVTGKIDVRGLVGWKVAEELAA